MPKQIKKPAPPPDDFFELIEIMENYLADLESTSHEVVLIPAPEKKHGGHQIRALQFANPQWYTRFNEQFMSRRGRGRKRMKRARTFIKKEYLIAELRRLLEVGDNWGGLYIERITEFIRVNLANEKYQKSLETAAD